MIAFIIYQFETDLRRLSELQELPVDLEPYVKKLMNSRRRVMLVNNILQNAQVLNQTILTTIKHNMNNINKQPNLLKTDTKGTGLTF